jgi:hypothetical protein
MNLLPTAIASSVVATLLLTAPADAQSPNRVQAGTLACNTSVEFGLIVGSEEALNCTFTPSLRGATEAYTGTIKKLGLDLGAARGVMVWLVYAPTSLHVGELAGNYAGVTAGATVGVGLGANVLVGGSNSTIALQPVSIDQNVGFNVAAGFAEMRLRAVR